MDKIGNWFLKDIELAKKLHSDKKLKKAISEAFNLMSKAITKRNKILIFGNGGSATDAQHFAAELICQFEKKRQAIPAIALTTDTSILTAQSNDYGFDSVFSRQVEALCRPGDVVFGITTSDVGSDGHSENILKAFQTAKRKRAKLIGLFSIKTKKLLDFVDVEIQVPATSTALIQQGHRSIIHLLCRLIEEKI